MDELWAGWRSAYIAGSADEPDGCLFCQLRESPADRDSLILTRNEGCYLVLNRYPYTTGHCMVVPSRHVASPGELETGEVADLWDLVSRCQQALEAAMNPDGFNLGANIGRGSGAGIPGHLHLHVVPRWLGDTNFMTATANTRVLPQALDDTWEKLSAQLAN